MRLLILSTMLAALGASCGGGSSAKSDAGDADTDTDSDSDTDVDTDMDTDVDTDTCGEVDIDVHDNCQDEEFPPGNEPDGCTRTLLSQVGGVGFKATSWHPKISRDGSTVVFTVHQSQGVCEGEQTALPEDTNGFSDVYAVDLVTGEMEIVSVSSDEEPGNGTSGEGSSGAQVSADGRYVVFLSDATNLTAEGAGSIYVRDRLLGVTELVSITHEGLPAGGFDPVISADGRWVVFSSGDSDVAPDDYDGEELDLFIRDRELGTTEILTVTDEGESVDDAGGLALISDDGRYVAFWHVATLCDEDLDPADWSDYKRGDLYIRDRQTGVNRLVSIAPDEFSEGRSAPMAFAADGSWVMFDAGNGAEHYHDTSLQEHSTDTILAQLDGDEIVFEPVVAAEHDLYTLSWGGTSADGGYVAFNERDSYETYGLNVALNPAGRSVANSFVLDRVTGEIDLVTASEAGVPGIVPDYEIYDYTMVDWGEIAVSGDGKRAVFTSIQYGMVDQDDYLIQCPNTPHLVYLRDCP